MAPAPTKDPRRGDILMLGISSAVSGALIGGMLLGLGMGLIADGANIGLLLVIPGAPAAALPGWLLARRYLAAHPEETR